MVRQFAGRLSLLVFGATAADGALMGSSLESVFPTGLVRMGVFYGFGLILGALGQWLVEEAAQNDFARGMAAAEANSVKA